MNDNIRISFRVTKVTRGKFHVSLADMDFYFGKSFWTRNSE
jgi:hypothetical protein